MKHFKSTCKDKEDFVFLYENVIVNKEGEFVLKEKVTPVDQGVEKGEVQEGT